jgi:hypothetical protein
MKKLILMIGFILLSGCAQTLAVLDVLFPDTSAACEQLEAIVFKDEACTSGLAGAGITGHTPSCLSEQDAEGIRAICPNF